MQRARPADIDPLLESAGELAIRAHLGRGDLGSALLEFDRYCDAVREGLGVSPSRTILELIEPALTESRIAMDSQRGEVPEVAAVSRPAAATPAVRRTVAIPGRPREPVVSTGGRGVGVRLLGVAALILAAALAVAGVGLLRDGGDTGASGDAGASGATVHPLTRVLPADRAIRSVEMVVRLVDAAAGRAAFLVRTTAQPTLVRLEVSGDAGRSIVRSVLVRSPARSPLGAERSPTGDLPMAGDVVGRVRSERTAAHTRPASRRRCGRHDRGSWSRRRPPRRPPLQHRPHSPAATSRNHSPPLQRPHPAGPPKDPGTRPMTPVG